ncbi:MAG: type 4b pilus protein PilO2 [Candidatus Symbiodolus clandestinus]
MSSLADAQPRSIAFPLSNHAIAVLGLCWQPLPSAEITLATQQSLLKRTSGSHWIIQKTPEHCQWGSIELADPPLLPTYSLSLQLIEQLGADWIAIIQLPEYQYGIIGVANGRVVPGCELVLVTVAKVVEHFHCYQTLFQWQMIYAPTALNLGGQPLLLDELLPNITLQTEQQLQVVSLPKQRSHWLSWRYMAVGSLLLGLGVGLVWQRHQQQKQVARLAEQRRRQQQRVNAQKAVPPWQQQPPALAVINRCMQAMGQQPLFLGGWRLAQVHCNPQTLRVTYQRAESASVKSFLAAVQRCGTTYQLEGNTQARLDYPITLPKNRPAERLPSIITVASELLQRFEQGIANGQIDDVLSSTKTHANFLFDSKTSPLILLQQLPLAGVVIHSLQARVQESGTVSWQCTGTLYGQ